MVPMLLKTLFPRAKEGDWSELAFQIPRKATYMYGLLVPKDLLGFTILIALGCVDQVPIQSNVRVERGESYFKEGNRVEAAY